MFVQFSVSNFLSFKDEAILSMLSAKIKSKDKELDKRTTFPVCKNITLLKSAVIYGANGSGKSNIFNAIAFMKKMVIDSSKESQVDEDISVKPFKLNPVFEEKESSFSMIFVVDEDIYEYSFSANKNAVTYESLTVSKKNKKEDVLFKRNSEGIIIHDDFEEGKGLEKRTRKNALFLSVCANFDGEVSTNVVKWFRKLRIIEGINDFGYLPFTTRMLDKEDTQVKIKKIIEMFDLDIVGIEKSTPGNLVGKKKTLFNAVVDKIKEDEAFKGMNIPSNLGVGISTTHNRFDDEGYFVDTVKFDLESDESEGTKKLVALAGPLMDVFDKSYILFIDEFDARLHPLITKKIIDMFNSKDINLNNAQLVVSTHDTNLLDKDNLRRDQIWFTEKDSLGGSHLKQLVEYKVRNDASYRKGYFDGDFGAIPMLGDPEIIFHEDVNDSHVDADITTSHS